MKTLLIAVLGFLTLVPTASLWAQSSKQPQQSRTSADLYIQSYARQMKEFQPPESSAEVRAQEIRDRYVVYDAHHRPLGHKKTGELIEPHLLF